MAGHSKWANIQHRKGRQDAVRAKLFSKLSKEIRKSPWPPRWATRTPKRTRACVWP